SKTIEERAVVGVVHDLAGRRGPSCGQGRCLKRAVPRGGSRGSRVPAIRIRTACAGRSRRHLNWPGTDATRSRAQPAKVRSLLPLSPPGVHAMPSSSKITLTAADGFKSSAYVSEPSGAPKGAIVVLQEIFGVNSHIRGVADGYAAAGYLAIAPWTFDRVARDVELGTTPDDVARGQ